MGGGGKCVVGASGAGHVFSPGALWCPSVKQPVLPLLFPGRSLVFY